GQAPIDRELLSRMNRTQRHRGPDGEGMHLAPGIGLGHTRLAIIDLDTGAQPMFNEDRSVVVVYNGEIYNFRDLRADLCARGHRFATASDTEVIVHAWEQWGEACVARLRGMFAFALWDQRRRILFLARDRIGIKPLLYAALPDGRLIFASELKALLAHPELPRRIEPQALEDYLAYGYVPDPKSIYRDVSKLRPGHWLAWRAGEAAPRQERYWQVRFAARQGLTAARAEGELIERLEEAVALRMVADVPLGAFLSGGIDSSAVVAMMSRHSSAPRHTCSIGFEESDHDETRFAQAVALAYGTRHHVGHARAQDLDLIERLPLVYDEPFADSSAIPTLQLSALARHVVTVALSGDGGDELFAGYRRYRWHVYQERVRRALPVSIRRGLFGFLGGIYPKLDWAPRPMRLKSTLSELALDPAGAYCQSVSITAVAERQGLYAPAFRRELQGYDAALAIRTHWRETAGQHPLDQAQYADLMTYLPGDILTKVDRASMAHSLEVRVPLLDHVLVEWAATLPHGLRLNARGSKNVLRRALEPYLPVAVLRRKKMGFAVPLAAWLRGPLLARVEVALAEPAFADSGLFEQAAIRRLIEQHRSGRRDHGSAIWALFMFAGFLQRVHGRKEASFDEERPTSQRAAVEVLEPRPPA
ncbi:MAG TPA: XrtA/PEP-CTERM system amidotransferase, partial [Geminicoccaceae bacterium]|nr:XrtA/PEP-CTERM system amidotransferase [Geminicoccaceae bacterium]